MSQPKVIFDSRQAKNVYCCETYYRSSSFSVGAGEMAIIEMTTHNDYRGCTTFHVLRKPPTLIDPECELPDQKFDKVYRCYNPAKEKIAGGPTNYTDDNRSILRLGYDKYNGTCNDFITISRPGFYYLGAERCDNPSLEDCANPTIVDMVIVPYQYTGNTVC